MGHDALQAAESDHLCAYFVKAQREGTFAACLDFTHTGSARLVCAKLRHALTRDRVVLLFFNPQAVGDRAKLKRRVAEFQAIQGLGMSQGLLQDESRQRGLVPGFRGLQR